ncbi:MAG: circularly permuted type 2 ATP-grasp protein [Polyangia bacterium]
MSFTEPAGTDPAVCRQAPRPGDGWLGRDGQSRLVARPLVQFLHGLGPAGLRECREQVRQRVRDHGVGYNVAGTAGGIGSEQTWRIDPLPALLDSSEYAVLAKGVAQRAGIVDRVLADLYGAQRIMRDGLLPARLVLGNPGFLRPCHGIGHALRLPLYGADVIRTASGALCLLRDRSHALTGAGYALANRLVISHVLEEPFRLGNVVRLAPFFQALRRTLAALAPAAREDPRIVLLSGGGSSPTYFEQAFLAQYLGYPLVEGGDLVVRERRVFLKMLGGLAPVDVILRQPEDDLCDPLELRADARLGVPGLVEATRVRQVAVANALGSGLAESPALLPFLPTIARAFFGEELALPSAPAYWLGDEKALAHVLAHVATMVFRPVWPGTLPSLVFGDRLAGAALASFLATVRARPEDFIAQELVTGAPVSVAIEDRLEPRQLVLRSYAVSVDQDYTVMPGGLALAAAGPDDGNISLGGDAVAKDLWVAGDAPAGDFSLLTPSNRPVELTRGGADLPSRSADNLFWFGRYAERSESLARLARHVLGRLAEEGECGPASAAGALPTLLAAVASASAAGPYAPSAGQPLPWLAGLLCSPRPGSLASTVRASMGSAAAARDRLSADTFRVLGSLGAEVERAAGLAEQPSLGLLTAFLDRVVTGLCALSGLAIESMTRGLGWRFLDLGRRLERALQLLALLRTTFAAGAATSGALLEALLVVADSGLTYRRRYLAGLHAGAVVDLLLLDESNPRAVLFQVAALREHLRQLPHDGQARLRPEERLALSALTRLELLDVGRAQLEEEGGELPQLQRVLDEVEAALAKLSDELCGGYLSHALLPRSLAGGVD